MITVIIHSTHLPHSSYLEIPCLLSSTRIFLFFKTLRSLYNFKIDIRVIKDIIINPTYDKIFEYLIINTDAPFPKTNGK